jgi:nicotinamide riboside transporter PnuC
MAPNLFRVLLVLVALYALLRGKRDERQVGLIFVIGVIATELVLPPARERFASVETRLMVVDLAVFAGFLWVALRSERFWPLWMAGLQLTAILGHVLKAIDVELFARAYAAALVFWAYPMLLILAVGTWRNERRTRRERDLAAT